MDPDNKNNWHRFQRLKIDRKKLDRRAKKAERATLKHARTFVLQRWSSIYDVRRRMLGWLLLVGLLVGITGLQMVWYQESYSEAAPEPGGTYAEGLVGPIGTLNPLFAKSSAEHSAAKMIFSGLFSYDIHNRMQGDLAKSWRLEDGGKRYVVTLKDDISWHDGKKLTSQDVVFTVNLLKNPKTNSPMKDSWDNISASAPDDKTIIFTLPATYSPFINALNFGVVPKHILKNIPPEQLRESSFSLHPVGSGPFVFRGLQNIDDKKGRSILFLDKFDEYFKGSARLDHFQLHTYGSVKDLERALSTHETNTVSELATPSAKRLGTDFKINRVPVNHGVYSIFRTDSTILKDKKVREALRFGTDRETIRKKVDGEVDPLVGPLLKDQVKGIANLSQPSFNEEQANQLLDQAGWKRGADGLRSKGRQPLTLSFVSLNSGDYPIVAKELAKQWKKLGVKVDTRLVSTDDIQQTVLQPRAYDVLLYELAIGADPDVYAYWHSSQRFQNGLNFANYKSGVADDALLSARARSEESLRDSKYTVFTRQWLADVPAVALYQPVIRYGTVKGINSVKEGSAIASPAERYRLVEYWTVKTTPHFKTP